MRPAGRRRGLPGAGRRRRRPHPSPPGVAARPGAAASTRDDRLTLAVPGHVVHRRPGARRARPARQGGRAPTPDALRRCACGSASERRARSARVASPRDRAADQPDRGQGRGGAGPRRRRCERLRGGRARGPRPRRAATPTRRSTWPATCVADGVEALVVVGGDGMVHLGVQAVAGTEHPARASSRPAPATTWPATSTCRARTRPRPPTRSSPAATRTVDLARRGTKYFVTVLAAGFDAIVNERANEMTWPKGQMRYNLATLAELRTFQPLPYTLDLDGETVHLRGDAGRGRQRPVVRRRAADHRGRHARRRPARRGGHQADEPAPAWSAPTRSCSRAPTSPTRSTSTTGSARSPSPRPGIVAYADGERFGALPLTVECAPGALTVLARSS